MSAIRATRADRARLDRRVLQLLAAMLGLAPQPPFRARTVLADADERWGVRVNRDGRLTAVVGDGVDVAARARCG